MMISPESIKENNRYKTLKELVLERNELLESIKRYEDRKILNDSNEFTADDMIKPSPAIRYYYNNQYLKEITELIIERLEE